MWKKYNNNPFKFMGLLIAKAKLVRSLAKGL